MDSLAIDFPHNDNPKTLLVLDVTCYGKKPDSPIMDILIPGHKHTVRIPFKPGELNIINSSLLNISCYSDGGLTNLPDGLYYITYRVYPHAKNFVVKPLLQTAQLENRYMEQLLNIGSSDCDVRKNKKIQQYTQNIDLFLQGAKAASRICNQTKVMEFYNKASELIDKIGSYTDCGCKN